MADHKEYLDEQYKLAALDYRTAYMKNMSILYWINDFSARILFTHFCVDSPNIYVGNRKKSLRILYKNKKLFCATF